MSTRQYDFDVIVVVMVHTRGSAPQEVGARITVGPEGLVAGTVGGGKVEQRVIANLVNLVDLLKFLGVIA